MRAPTPSAAAELVFPDSEAILGRIDELAKRARLNVLAGIDARKKKIDALLSSRALSSPKNYIEDKRMALAYLTDKLDTLAQKSVSDKRKSYAALLGKLEALSPLAVLSRGYAMVSDEARARTLTHAGKLCVGERVRLRFSDGEALAQIREIALNESESDHGKKENG
jgi:exodeoxyribonuclease VII large subunit